MNSLDIYKLGSGEYINGKYLIEANAGSGKTWQIATLYCWLIANEEKYQVNNIVVNTFTKSATAELRERIVNRLQEFYLNIKNVADKKSNSSLNKLNIPDDHWQSLCKNCAQVEIRLKEACEQSEFIKIHTIHSFMIDIIYDNAIVAGVALKTDIIDEQDEYKLWQESLAYAWRRALLTNDLQEYLSNTLSTTTHDKTYELIFANNLIKAFYYNSFADIDTLGETLNPLKNNPNVTVDTPENLGADNFQLWFELSLALSTKINNNQKELIDNLDNNINQQSYKTHQIMRYINSAIDYFFCAGGIQPSVNKVNIYECKNNIKKIFPNELLNKRKKTLKGILTLNPIFFEIEKIFNQWIEPITKFINFIQYHQTIFSYQSAQEYFTNQLQSRQQITFTEVINTAHQLITNGDGLSQKIISNFQKQNRVLLIDEFQDTDLLQWEIYQKLQKDVNHQNDLLLVVVGDPKQSIYQFRTADIYTYFRAKDEMHNTIILDSNYRAYPQTVNAVNQLFNVDNGFENSHINYTPSYSKKDFSKDENKLVDNQPYKLILFPDDVSSVADKTELAFTDMAKKILQIRQSQPQAEIAVLVNKNKQAEEVAVFLGKHKIPTINESNNYSSLAITSSFTHLLIAINKTYRLNNSLDNFIDNEILKLINIDDYNFANVLFSPLWLESQDISQFWQIFNQTDLNKISENEKKLIRQIKQYLLNFAQVWQNNGLLGIFKVLQNSGLEERLIANSWSVRDLKILEHLCLWLQQKTHNPEEQIILLKEIINNNINKNEVYGDCENILLTNNNHHNPVNIYTVFKAKGQQWDYVFCPFMWQGDDKRPAHYYQHDLQIPTNNGWHINIYDRANENIKNLIDQNYLEEKIRIFYVFVTRAIRGTYLYWEETAIDKKTNLTKEDKRPIAKIISKLLSKLTEEINPNEKNYWQIEKINSQIINDENCKSETDVVAEDNKHSADPFAIYSSSEKIVFPQTLRYISFSYLSKLFENKNLVNNEKINKAETNINQQVVAGIEFGIAVHSLIAEVLEKFQNQNINLKSEGNNNLDEVLNYIISNKYYLSQSENEELFRETLNKFVKNAIDHNLPFYADKKIIDLDKNSAQCEWAFTLKWDKVHNQKWQTYCDKINIPFVQLPESGFITGSLDAVVLDKQNNKFYIIDFKTNIVGNDRATEIENLSQLINQNYYQLQAAIYTLAFHRYLLNNFQNYQYQKNLGGVWFNFIRNGVEGRENYYSFTPDDLYINELNEIFV